jgi:hypothetical protein
MKLKSATIAALLMTVSILAAAPAKAALLIYYEEPFSLGVNAERRFELGELNGQHGWTSVPGRAQIARWGFDQVRVGAGCVSRGAAFGFETLMQSPRFATFPNNNQNEDFVMTMLTGFRESDVSWYITPINVSHNKIVTRIKFEAGGAVKVLVPDGQGGSSFVQIPNFTWEPIRNYTIVIASHDDGLLQISIDNRDVIDFEGGVFAHGIEAISIQTDNQRAGRAMIIDKIRVRRGHSGWR